MTYLLSTFCNFLTTFWQLFYNFLTNFWQIFWQFFDNFLHPFLTTFWQLFDNFLTIFWQLFDNFLTTFWQLLTTFLTTFWQFFFYFLTQCDTITQLWHHKSSSDPQMTAEGTEGAPTCFTFFFFLCKQGFSKNKYTFTKKLYTIQKTSQTPPFRAGKGWYPPLTPPQPFVTPGQSRSAQPHPPVSSYAN
jgi:hypothetical protein